MSIVKLFVLLSVVLSFPACNAGDEYEKKESAIEQSPPSINQDDETRMADFAGDSIGQKEMDEKRKKQPGGEPVAKTEWDKKIIKTAILNLEVKDYHAFYNSLREKVRAAGGYIAQEEQTRSEYKIENSLTIKVPVDQFDAALAQIGSSTEKINDKKISSQDVTAEMFDTKSRLEAKKQVRLRYLDLLKQAKNMQEILSVQSEINSIQEEIESAAGRIQYLGHSSAFSTIHLTYFQVLNLTAKDVDTPGFGSKLGDAFRSGWNWVGSLCIGLVSIWPVLLLIITGVFIFKRQRLQKPKQA